MAARAAVLVFMYRQASPPPAISAPPWMSSWMSAASLASTPSGVITLTCTPAISRASTVAGMSAAPAANPLMISSSVVAICFFQASASSSGGDVAGLSSRSTTICCPAAITAWACSLTVGGTRIERSNFRVPSAELSAMAGTYRRRSEPRYGMRRVRLLEPCDLLGREHEVDRGDRVVEVVRLGGADDRRGDAGLRQHPRRRHLGHRYAALRCDLADPLDDRAIRRLRVEALREGVALRARRRLVPRPRQLAPRERAPRD